MPRTVLTLVSFMFVLSGVSALIFETLWFRQAGLTFGNSVVASALVLSSFMAGLALGNGMAARYGHLLRRPLRFYGWLEIVVAVAGVLLVLLLPRAITLLAFVFRPLVEVGWLLQPARFLAGFALMLAPAAAMGATLPILVKALSEENRDFGRLLGRLYGWNTLGAVVGAVTGELLWIPLAGVIGSACIAAGFNLMAAALAFGLARRGARSLPAPVTEPRLRLTYAASRLLVASFLAGGILLALEVVWFRMLALRVVTTSEAFALMLAIVLAGIGCGSLLGALWLRVRPEAHTAVAALALASGAMSILAYAGLPDRLLTHKMTVHDTAGVLSLAAPLMFAVCMLSGMLFTMLGKGLHERLASGVRAAGLVALANTTGAMLGPLAAGFVLLPRIGMERSLFVLSIAYAGVALSALGREAWASRGRLVTLCGAAVLFASAVLTFPSGLMWRVTTETIALRYPGEQLVAVREGLTQTIVYTRLDFLGQPFHYRLSTDSYSMSGTMLKGERYMALFAHLPLAFHPGPKRALLISYGVGTTAKSLSENGELESIDVVDISRDILELSEVPYGAAENPLNDRRVAVHIEDARYFLETTRRSYDLITAEPPPPAMAGIVNLYTREYFELLRERLAEGGVVSYWLPVEQLALHESQAIVRAFCDIFADCSLWDGALGNWILLGTRNATGRLTVATVRRQWADPHLGARLRAIGIERAEQLAALFLADSSFLRAWSLEALPLVDNWPARAPRLRAIFPLFGSDRHRDPYASLTDGEAVRRRFKQSAFLERMWPPELREKSLEFFDYQRMVRDHVQFQPMGSLHRVLTQSSLETLPLWLLGSSVSMQGIVDRVADDRRFHKQVEYQLGLRALSQRDYALAADRLSGVPRGFRRRDDYHVYALAMAGRLGEAQREVNSGGANLSADTRRFMRGTFGF